MTPEPGKLYRTRDGSKARIYAVGRPYERIPKEYASTFNGPAKDSLCVRPEGACQ